MKKEYKKAYKLLKKLHGKEFVSPNEVLRYLDIKTTYQLK